MDAQSSVEARKRALDALERRFALTKATEELQQSRSKRKKHTEKEISERGDESMLATSSEAKPSSSRFGNFAFLDRPSQRELSIVQGQDLTYLNLPDNFHENLLKPIDKPAQGAENAVKEVMHDLFQNGDVAHKYIQGSRNIKIGNWVLLDNFIPNDFSSATAHMKALQTHSKRSKRYLSMKQHKKLGSLYLSPSSHKHELFKLLHESWTNYITKLIKENWKKPMPQRLLAADLHGAILLVVQCKQAAFVGFSGIMIRETEETFGIISEDDKFRVVPKKGSVFIFQAGDLKITLIGDKLSQRTSAM